MLCRPSTLVLPLAALLAAVMTVLPARAQDPPPAEGEPEMGLEEILEGEDQGLGDIDEILRGEEEVLGGGGYTYDPGDRRDPFKSLLAARDRPELLGPRPDGIPGLLIDEVNLTGIFKTTRGFVAQVQAGKKEKSFLIREGDRLYDGDVVSISRNEVAFRQLVQDPTALKPFREVTKSLDPTAGPG